MSTKIPLRCNKRTNTQGSALGTYFDYPPTPATIFANIIMLTAEFNSAHDLQLTSEEVAALVAIGLESHS
jgi:hypothetical protein